MSNHDLLSTALDDAMGGTADLHLELSELTFIDNGGARILVRAAHRNPLNPPKDTAAVDPARFKAMLASVAGAVAGPGNIKSVELTSQTPLRHVRMPST